MPKWGHSLHQTISPLTLASVVLKAEREFNRKAGFTIEDDRLPSFSTKNLFLPITRSLLSATRKSIRLLTTKGFEREG